MAAPFSRVIKVHRGKGTLLNALDNVNYTESIGVKILSVVHTGSSSINRPILITSESCNLVANLDTSNPLFCVLCYGLLTNKQLVCNHSEIYSVINPSKEIHFTIQYHDSNSNLKTLRSFEGYLYVSISYLC